MKDFFNYPEPLYLELDNKFKEEVISYFRWIMSKKQKVLISFDHNGCTKVSEGGEGFYTKFLFSKLESLGDVSDLYLLVDSKIRLSLSAVGGCAAGAVSGGSCGEGAKLAVIAQGLKIAMDSYSGYKSSLKTSKGNAVIKLEGNGVENNSVTNTGTSVEVKLGSTAVTNGLVGRDVATLSEDEVKMLQNSLVKKDSMNFYSWSAESRGVVFDSSNVNYWISEYSTPLNWSSRNLNGFRAFSVFHDKWMTNWNINNSGVLIATIAPAMGAQYYALGVGNYHYYMNNLKE